MAFDPTHFERRISMPSVYEPGNFAGRVNYAAAVISRKGGQTRHFDTCFEMWDGVEVAVAVYRRSLKKWFVYQPTENRDELKVSYFQLVAEGRERGVQAAESGPGAV